MVISLRSKRSRFNRIFGSLFFRLTVVFLVITVVPLILVRTVIMNSVWKSMWNDRMDNVLMLSRNLTDSMVKYGYFDGFNNDIIHGQLMQLANVYEGRGIIIDDTFSVIRDSYARINNSYVVSAEAVKAMQGIDIIEYSEDFDMINLAMGIYDGQAIRGVLLLSSSTADLSELFASIQYISTIVFVGTAAVVIVIVFLATRLTTKPFKRLVNSINIIAEGDYDEKVDIGGYHEIHQISDAVNAMTDKLSQIEISRQEFVSNVSHELKTPITSIKVLADSLIMQDNVPIELYKEFMQDIVVEIDRENNIISDLLELVKVDSRSGDVLNYSVVNIKNLLELIMKRLKPIAAKKDVELVIQCPVDIVAVCDEVKMTLAFSNLIENGIKYNVNGGWVQVTLEVADERYKVTVSDSGIGIPAEYQSRVFERFYRVDKARSRETGGTGLGLAITKNIIMLHGGTISVSSKENEGTQFVVDMPISPDNASGVNKE